MKKKGIMLLLCLSLTSAGLGLVACGEEEQSHTHTFDTTTWSSDATKHWHAATCEHSTEKADVDGHVDENIDGTCDTCGYDGGHVHTFGGEWQSDATGHWKNATCFHDVTSEVEAHTEDEMGNCTVCGYDVSDPDVSTVAKAIAFATTQKGKVENGSIVKNGNWFGTITDYIYADGYLYTNTKQTLNVDEETYTESWYSTDANGDVFAVSRNQDGEVNRMTAFADSISKDNLSGYQFVSPVTNTIGDFYGLEALIAGLYEVGETNLNKDFAEKVEDGKYSFSYGYFEDGLYIVEVDFTLSSEYYVDEANVKVTFYGADFNWETYEYDYKYEVIPGATEEDADTYKVKEGAEGYVQTNYTITQNVQEVVENEYPADEVLVSSYKLVDADGTEVGDTLTIEKGEGIYLYLAETAPDTAIVELTEVLATGDAIDNYELFVNQEDDTYGNWAIRVVSYDVGEYSVKIAVNGVEKTLTVNVIEAQPTEIIVKGYTEEEGRDWMGTYTYYAPYSVGSEITVYEGESVVLSAEANKGDDVSCTATVNDVQATLEEIAWENPAEYENGYIDALFLDTTTAGTYTVVFASTALETLTETITVNVLARPDMAEVLNGKYIYQANGYNAWEVEFAPDEDGATKGTMSIAQYVNEYDEEADKEVLVKYDAEYAYAWTNEEGVESFDMSLVNGYDFGSIVEVGEATAYAIEVNGNALVKETLAMVLAGTWESKVFDYDVSFTEPVDTYTLTFNVDGTGVYKAEGVEFYFTYTIGEFDETNRNYPITISADESATNVGETTAFGASATVTFGEAFSMITYTKEWTILVDNGEVDEGENTINYEYKKPTVTAEDGYVWPTEITVGDAPTNVYCGQYETGVKEIELLINADKAGTYTVVVCAWGETAPIVTLDQYYFDMNGVKVVGAMTFEVEETERIVLTMGIVNESFDFDIYVNFVEAEKEEEEGGNTGVVDSIYDGSVVVVDNMGQNGGCSGTYEYLIADDGSVAFYKDGVLDETMYITFADGTYSFKCSTLGSAQAMIAQDGQSDISGVYNIDLTIMAGIEYTLTFTEYLKMDGSVVVVDNMGNGGGCSGTYDYVVMDDGSVAFYKDGVLDETMYITLVEGTYMFKCSTLGSAQAMIAQDGQSDISGVYNIDLTIMEGIEYTLTFTAGSTSGGEDAGNEGTETTAITLAVGGSTEITIPGGGTDTVAVVLEGVEAGTYSISIDTSALGLQANNMTVFVQYSDNEEDYVDLTILNNFTAEITVEAGATLLFGSFTEFTTTVSLNTVSTDSGSTEA